MKKKLSILILLLICGLQGALAQMDSFYTDDSSYFQKIHKDGFSIRFSLEEKDCFKIKDAQLLLRRNSLIGNFPFQQMDEQFVETWKEPYGMDSSNYCWFTTQVTGQDLNTDLQYSIKITTKDGQELFYNAEDESIIPANRLKREVTHWLTPGAMGATPVVEGGVLFKIWEPEAERVDIRINQKDTHKMTKSSNGQNIHFIYLKESKTGDEYTYHFVKNGKYEELEVGNNNHFSSIKVDPMAKELVYDKKGGSLNGYLNPRAVVVGEENYRWEFDNNILGLVREEIPSWIIYQLWPLTFNPKEVNGKYKGGTFEDIAEKINYLEDLGINTIEFLPVHESRFHASWGYALDSLTLIEKNYGSAKQLRSLVDLFHSRNLKVVFDVVLNHVNNSLIRDPLTKTRFKTKYYGGNTPWGPKPDFNNPLVRKWLAESIINLVRDYHLDGLRFDMIESIYKGSKAGYKFLQELNYLLKKVQPHIYLSAEQLPDNAWATFPLSENGLAFDSQWNDKFKNFFELKFDHYRENQRYVDFGPIKGSLLGYSNHDAGSGEYHFRGADRTVNYLGCHDFVGNKNPFIRIISGFESYESSGENYFTRVRPLEIEDKLTRESKFRSIHSNFTHEASLTSYGILFTKPGGVLFFQGEEMASDINIENEWSYVNAKENNSIPTVQVNIDQYVRSHRVPWEYLESRESNELDFLSEKEHNLFQQYHRFFKDMIEFRRDHPEINLNDAQDVKECSPGILCYRLERGPNELFILVNYGFDQKDMWIHFPGNANDWWHESLSLSNARYSQGKREYLNVISNLGGRSNNVRMAGPSISVFTKKRSGEIKEDLYLRSNLNEWQALSDQQLRRSSDKGELYTAVVRVEKKRVVKFKIASIDWKIELGASSQVNSLLTLTNEEGFLTYSPGAADAEVELEPGLYHFLFDIKNFNYRFIKL